MKKAKKVKSVLRLFLVLAALVASFGFAPVDTLYSQGLTDDCFIAVTPFDLLPPIPITEGGN